MVHSAGLLQVPVALHVWTPLPEQRVVPGAQTPVHPPETHACDPHGAGVPHVPVVLHVSTPLPEHCVVPGVHTPWHMPPTHA